MKKTILVLTILAFSFIVKAQEKINWISLNEALELQKENPKKIMMDVYTNWCGPCKMLDKQTFQNKDLIKYVNEHYYAVKFNGEGNEIINYKGEVYNNPDYDETKANRRNSSHKLSNYLRIRGYPTIAFFDEKANFIYPLVGFQQPQQLELYLKMFSTDKYKEIDTNEKFKVYYEAFKSEFKSK
ncbi:thioredoxin fold domain-containing protein [uncultured Polaribacter sp.]|uniref:thioredoxin family protein n=1 Tax=uncultured Polaribacter sp. TaxID=174711 RepID=UPI002630AC07|nr:thioredoxin fold domain-containing protein [uncultured Polaribacter sp.]